MTTFTQSELVIEWLKEFREIVPAKMAGKIYRGIMFGSETSKRCREMRKKGIVKSEGDGKFTKFFLKDTQTSLF